MKNILTLAALLVAASSLSMASTTCPMTSLAALILLDGGGCTWTTADGAVETLNNFSLVNNNAGLGTLIPASSWTPSYIDSGSSFRITLTPSSTVTETSPGGGQGSLYQFLLQYLVTETTPAGNGSGQLTSEILGATVAGINGDGGTQVVKSLTDGVGAPLGSPSVTFITPGGATKTSSLVFAPQGSIAVADSFNVNSGTDTGASATLSSFFNEVGATTGVPEPTTMGLIGAGLVGLGLISRRKTSHQA